MIFKVQIFRHFHCPDTNQIGEVSLEDVGDKSETKKVRLPSMAPRGRKPVIFKSQTGRFFFNPINNWEGVEFTQLLHFYYDVMLPKNSLVLSFFCFEGGRRWLQLAIDRITAFPVAAAARFSMGQCTESGKHSHVTAIFLHPHQDCDNQDCDTQDFFFSSPNSSFQWCIRWPG